jgi:hypothetical protein
VKSLRQILIVVVTAFIAITAGRMLRDVVDQGSAPTAAPSALGSPSPSESP